jgi:hypothetical protein
MEQGIRTRCSTNALRRDSSLLVRRGDADTGGLPAETAEPRPLRGELELAADSRFDPIVSKHPKPD